MKRKIVRKHVCSVYLMQGEHADLEEYAVAGGLALIDLDLLWPLRPGV